MNTIALRDVRNKVELDIIAQRDRCIADTRKNWNHDFYVIIQYLPKRKGDKKGVQINIAALEGIPTPTFDTTLFKYIYKNEKLELLWTLPSEEYALNLYHNRDKVHPDDYPLLEQVLKYFDGTIFDMIAQWENSDGTLRREREHSSRPVGRPKSGLITSP